LVFDGQEVDFDDADTYYRVSTVNYLAAGSCNFNNAGISLWPLNQIVNGLRGWPYYKLNSLGTTWPTGTLRPSVQVTARWGWDAVPAPVRQSTLHLAASLFKLEHAPFGVLAVGDFGPIKAPADTLRNVKALLEPYRRGDQTLGIGSV
jgi:hypothetical protein